MSRAQNDYRHISNNIRNLVSHIHVNGVNEWSICPWLPSECVNGQNEPSCCRENMNQMQGWCSRLWNICFKNSGMPSVADCQKRNKRKIRNFRRIFGNPRNGIGQREWKMMSFHSCNSHKRVFTLSGYKTEVLQLTSGMLAGSRDGTPMEKAETTPDYHSPELVPDFTGGLW